MPNTYVALRTETVAVATNTVTFSLSGISGYTDLRLVARGVSSGGDIDLSFRLNGDTGSNYSRTFLWGSGSTAGSGRSTGLSFGRLNYAGYWTTSNESVITADFMNYSNTTTFKTVLSRDNNSAVGVGANVNLWRSTAAITSIEIYTSAFNFAVGSTFSLYGIANADQGSAKATGGIITEDSQYWYHTFGASGAFIPKQSLTCDVLVVAGGGGGGSSAAGGGGAGGLLYYPSQSLTAISYNVAVGAGGTSAINTRGGNGVNSTFGSLTSATGGGGGAGNQTSQNPGSDGGSGGGAAIFASNNSPGSASPAGQGNNGGGSTSSPSGCGGGGGGAGAAGGTGSGGDGVSTYSSWGLVTSTGENISGTVWYAGGGGGSRQNSSANAAPAGRGGGTAGAITGTNASNSPANTGGGGGAGWDQNSALGGRGGSGVVIVRYSK
jgi:hypothetical protein